MGACKRVDICIEYLPKEDLLRHSSQSNEECKPVVKESCEFRFGYVHGIIIVERGS